MAHPINPFHDLYLTEAIGADKFVKLFSPLFVQQALALFQPGNVVLKGLQGSGKTMLLNLLKPEIRIAYHLAGKRFPIPKEFQKFISAGINLTKSGVKDVGQLLLPESEPKFVKELALLFGDFVNYWVVDDLLATIETLRAGLDNTYLEEMGLAPTDAALDTFAVALANDPCWFDVLTDTTDFQSLRKKLQDRIVLYRRYINLNFNEDQPPDEIKHSKTTIGDPISKAVEWLRKSQIIGPDVQVFVRIDQYEQLPLLDHSGHEFGNICQEVVHKALASRDPQVSYCIGTRHYAWPEAPVVFGTRGVLENKRDYSIVNIDEKLRRKENRSTWMFPDFAEDIFERRLALTNYTHVNKATGLLKSVFGRVLSPAERAEKYVRGSARRAIVQEEPNWPREWIHCLEELVSTDPFSAMLAQAWVRQKDKRKQGLMNETKPFDSSYPWDKKPYWKKERTEQALLQIASANRQQLNWAGEEDILGLSGGNILVFLFLCQHVWDAWLRDTRDEKRGEDISLPSINVDIQTVGIIEASEEWLRKPNEGEQATKRQKFVAYLGKHFYKQLTGDKSMSNPGRNGFSILVAELDTFPQLNDFLKLATDFGDLYDGPHTSKTKGEKRKKYYLAPILCPAFKIPYKHTKEPEYVSATRVIEWLSEPLTTQANNSRIELNQRTTDSVSPQGSLFSDGDY